MRRQGQERPCKELHVAGQVDAERRDDDDEERHQRCALNHCAQMHHHDFAVEAADVTRLQPLTRLPHGL